MDEQTKRRLGESIRGWEARPRYSALNASVLATIPDDLLEQAILDFVWAHGVVDSAESAALLVTLPAGFRTVYTTWLLDAEVGNGGFHQYFWNTEAQYVALTEEGLQRLGANRHLAVFEEAAVVFRRENQPDVSANPPEEQLKAFSESATESGLNELDDKWYALGELAEVRLRFIRENPSLFEAVVSRELGGDA